MTHASRTDRLGTKGLEGVERKKLRDTLEWLAVLVLISGERVSNTWVIYPKVGNNCSKGQLIPHNVSLEGDKKGTLVSLREEPAAD